MKNTVLFHTICVLLLFIAGQTTTVSAQTTEFSYQGFLSDTSASANGSFDFEFRLFETVNGGVALATQPRPNVTVTNGVFSVVLDFGNFPSANRFLEIAVRPSGGGAFTTLAPRSKLLSTPYATNAINAQNAANAQSATNATTATTATNAANAQTAQNALQLGGVAANQFVLTGDTRLNDARNPLPGNANYIQNTATQQTATNFNISGNGTAGGTLAGSIVTATTQFNIGTSRILSSPGSFNFFAGNLAGFNNSTGTGNSFFGSNAGVFNTTGGSNAFFGFEAGRNNNAGASNSYFGKDAGRSSTIGNDNSFFGNGAGAGNTTGSSNSFFGARAGNSNTNSGNNTFVGFEAGSLNTSGFDNSFFGARAGNSNANQRNSFFGARAGSANTDGGDNSFFGIEAGSSNTTAHGNSFFGAYAGASNTTGTQNAFFGREAGQLNSTGRENSFFGHFTGRNNVTGIQNSFFGAGAGGGSTGNFNSYFGYNTADFSTTSTGNSYFGHSAGKLTSTGSYNTFVGWSAGKDNRTGDDNTLIGSLTDVGSPGLTNAAAVGANAYVTQSDSIVLGSIANVNGASQNTNVGIGTTAPLDRLHVNGIIRVAVLGAAGGTSLCRNANNQISTCSSSLRYKTDISSFRSGLNLASKLQPIVFNWKEGGIRDLGLGAEDVEKVEPLLVTYNEKGEVEGVKYDRVAIVLLNAVKEQQFQIEQQQALIEEQKNQLSAQQSQIEEQRKKAEAQQMQLDRQAAQITELAQTLRQQISDNSPKSAIKRSKKQ